MFHINQYICNVISSYINIKNYWDFFFKFPKFTVFLHVQTSQFNSSVALATFQVLRSHMRSYWTHEGPKHKMILRRVVRQCSSMTWKIHILLLYLKVWINFLKKGGTVITDIWLPENCGNMGSARLNFP